MRVFACIAAIILLVSGIGSAQQSYTTGDGVLSVVLPAGWVATEDAAQMFITNRAGITANLLESGDVALAILRPALLRELVGKARFTPQEAIQALIPLAEQEGAQISTVSTSEYGAFPAATFAYTVRASGYAARFVVVRAGMEQVAVQIVTSADAVGIYAQEIDSIILSLRVASRSLSGIGGKSAK